MPQVKIQEPKTDTWKTITISEEQFNALHDLNEGKTSKDKILLDIQNLNTSSEIKSFLELVVTYTIKISGTIIHIGKKVVHIILYLIKNFPHTLIGTIIGYVIGSILSEIPLLGWVLAWVIVPLSTLIGAGFGAKVDLSHKNVSDEIKKKIHETFFGIKNIAV